MKTNAFKWFALAAAVLSLAACKLDDDSYDPGIVNPSALVTVKPDANGGFLMQLNDETVLRAVNLSQSPFGSKEVRALVNFREPKEDEVQLYGSITSDLVYVNWMDSILTKQAVSCFGKDDSIYGNDPVEIVDDWTTVVEDGYLTLRFRTIWGAGTMHKVNLVTGTDPSNPFKVVFHHDAGGDHVGETGDALVAFRLNGIPDTEGKDVDLTLEWQSFSGIKTATFKYRTRVD